MKNFNFTLSVQVQAKDREEAVQIAQHAGQLLKAFQNTSLHATFPYKVDSVEVDHVEEW